MLQWTPSIAYSSRKWAISTSSVRSHTRSCPLRACVPHSSRQSAVLGKSGAGVGGGVVMGNRNGEHKGGPSPPDIEALVPSSAASCGSSRGQLPPFHRC